MSDKLLNVKETADLLSVKTSTIYHWSHIGYIPTVKLGNLIRFRRHSLLKWLEKKETKGRVRKKYKVDMG